MVKIISFAIFLLISGLVFIFLQRSEIRNDKSIDDQKINQIQSKKIPITPLNFILLGDTGSGTKSQFEVANSIEKYCNYNNCQAAFIAGDVIYDNGITSVGDPQLISKFEDPYKNLNFPFYIALGNHDYRGCIDCYIEYSKLSSKWKIMDKYYTQLFSNIEFFVIDTENFDKNQQQWLNEALIKSAADWKIVVGHRPLKTFEEAYFDEKWAGKDILVDILCQKADLYVSGHAHILEDAGLVNNCSVKQVISGAGGAALRNAVKDNKSEFNASSHGFAVIASSDNNLNIQFINTENEVIYSREIN